MIPKIKTLIPFFGGNRMLGSEVGKQLEGCSWVGIPFAGGMPELLYINASTIVVSDVHRHVINLARQMANKWTGPKIIRILRRLPFHPDLLEAAQNHCLCRQNMFVHLIGNPNIPLDSLDAIAYFVSQWMGRSAKAGTDGEFRGKLPVRWSASGGDSCTRYRSAVESMTDWRKVLQKCNFVIQDAFEFIGNVKDEHSIGVYLDPPFPGPGDAYVHKLTEEQHKSLAKLCAAFIHARVVCRFYDTPFIRQLYPEPLWSWKCLIGRKQSNDDAPEVLLTLNGKP